jgi:hypothetical protein
MINYFKSSHFKDEGKIWHVGVAQATWSVKNPIQWHPTTVRVGESPRSWASNSGWSQNHWASMAPNHRVGESPRSQASNYGQSQNHWASMAPNHSESRRIPPVPGFQFWPKSESLGLNGSQLQWYTSVNTQWANPEGEESPKGTSCKDCTNH